MKVLQILFLILGLSVFANSQTNNKSTLSGIVYDANGSVVVRVKVTAVNQKGEKVETVTNDEGIYTLNVPFNQVKAFSPVFKYDIIVDAAELGFKKSITKEFVFIPSQFGKMQLDIALEAGYSVSCDSADCLESPIVEEKKVLKNKPIIKRK